MSKLSSVCRRRVSGCGASGTILVAENVKLGRGKRNGEFRAYGRTVGEVDVRKCGEVGQQGKECVGELVTELQVKVGEHGVGLLDGIVCDSPTVRQIQMRQLQTCGEQLRHTAGRDAKTTLSVQVNQQRAMERYGAKGRVCDLAAANQVKVSQVSALSRHRD
jgi:hypothetical protein